MLKDRKTDHRQTDRQMDIQTQTNRQHTYTARQTDRYRHADRQTKTDTDRQTYIKTETDTDRQTYTARQIDKHTERDRQTEL